LTEIKERLLLGWRLSKIISITRYRFLHGNIEYKEKIMQFSHVLRAISYHTRQFIRKSFMGK